MGKVETALFENRGIVVLTFVIFSMSAFFFLTNCVHLERIKKKPTTKNLVWSPLFCYDPPPQSYHTQRALEIPCYAHRKGR
jgi:hypothetical protein